jgi:glycine/D-amino acid oxidase-like deaminating enzyme
MARLLGRLPESRRRFPANSRIAIVGAGISGMTAASSLIKKGYRRITLFEASDRIGGKVESVQIDGQWVELGAAWVLRSSKALYRMHLGGGGPKLRPMPHKLCIAEAPGSSESWLPLEKYWRASPLEVAKGIWAFNRLIRRPGFRCIFQPGFYDQHRDLSFTMAEFAAAHGFGAIIEPFQAVLYANGYGAMTSIPALYHLKLIAHFEKARLLRRLSLGMYPGAWMVERYGQFWEDLVSQLIARGLRLRLGCKVTSAVRETALDPGRPIRIIAGGKTEAFDLLIVATSPNQTLEYLDVTQEERDLFGRVRYFDFHSVLFRAAGLDEDVCLALRYNMIEARPGPLFCLYSWRSGSGLFLGYQSSHQGISTEELDRKLAEDIAGLGGSLERVAARRAWSYFPHVGVEDLSTGYYERLNSLQGRSDTYFLGALFCFETTEHCAEFAEFLVERHF